MHCNTSSEKADTGHTEQALGGRTLLSLILTCSADIRSLPIHGVPFSTMKNVAGAVWSCKESFADKHPKAGMLEYVTSLDVGCVSTMLLK